jgi:ATP/maltotriose-dependent transcriptional regulator MalT
MARVLAALGVGVWCFFLFFVSLGLIIDRGLADVGIAWVGVLGIGVGAPVLLLWQVNRAIAAHEASRRVTPVEREKEKELLGALEEHRELTPATAAMRTSLTVNEASKMLEELARKGHLEPQTEDGVTAYALNKPDDREPPASVAALPGPDAGETPLRLEDPLSERELEVLTMLASGKTNSEVAKDLFVSVGTVKSHTGNIYRKLGARNRTEALARARELGMLR